jgi:ankyrin repeat domain-containing protein 50
MSTKAVLFLGTPHRGSSKAETGEMLRRIASASGFSTSDKNLRALNIDSSELEGIHERFLKLRKQNQWHFETRTFQEAKGMTGLGFLGLGEKVS